MRDILYTDFSRNWLAACVCGQCAVYKHRHKFPASPASFRATNYSLLVGSHRALKQRDLNGQAVGSGSTAALGQFCPTAASGPKRPQRRNRSIASLDAEKPSAVKNSRAPSRPARRTQVICASESTIRLTNALPTPCRRCGAATTTIER